MPSRSVFRPDYSQISCQPQWGKTGGREIPVYGILLTSLHLVQGCSHIKRDLATTLFCISHGFWEFCGIPRLICFSRKTDNRRSLIDDMSDETPVCETSESTVSASQFFNTIMGNEVSRPELIFSVDFDDSGSWRHRAGRPR